MGKKNKKQVQRNEIPTPVATNYRSSHKILTYD